MNRRYTRLAAQWGLVLALTVPALAGAQSATHTAAGSEPTIADIYAAAEAGKLSTADGLIAQVLAAHPASAKAHFVHAELLAKEGKLATAKSEYLKADELAPGLPFAKPQAVAGLLERIAPSSANRATERAAPNKASTTAWAPAESSGMGTPAKVGIVLLMLAAGVFMFRRIVPGRPSGSASGSMTPPAGYAAAGPSYAGPQGYAQAPSGYAPAPAPAAAPAGGGLGSALMTGAAMGLGAVAVEEAVRHFSHRDARVDDAVESRRDTPAFANNLGPDTNADMGGNDFGISDTGSWDDGSATNNNSDW